jgi:hypothetical protein
MVASVGCGYVSAGQWDNDPHNWERAFHQPVPPGWQIVQSRCYRYPHFTWEGGYYFHVRVATETDKSYMHPDYFRLTAEQAKNRACDSTPAWFPPRETSDYEIWGAPSAMDRYIVYVHRTGAKSISRTANTEPNAR